MLLKTLATDFINLIYPNLCAACSKTLCNNEQSICTTCKYSLPRTGFHNEQDNPVEKMFWGRANINAAAAYLYFGKKSKVQNIMHELKYRGRKEIGIEIGRIYGSELSRSPVFGAVQVIIPVPLHPKKQRERGYNQSEMFACGLACSMGVSLDVKTLHRQVFTATQTKKNRMQRWDNVNSVFCLRRYSHLVNRHILLVDDVITTGSTLDACANTLLCIPGAKVSIATIAMAI